MKRRYIAVMLLCFIMVSVFVGCKMGKKNEATETTVPTIEIAPTTEPERVLPDGITKNPFDDIKPQETEAEEKKPTEPTSNSNNSNAGTSNTTVEKEPEEAPIEAPDAPARPSGTKPTRPTDPAKPTDPEKPTGPAKPTDPEKTTDPAKPTDPEKPTDPTKPTEGVVKTEYELFMEMSAEEQNAYMMSFSTVDQFFAWFNAAKEAHDAQSSDITVGNGTIDMGAIIEGKN